LAKSRNVIGGVAVVLVAKSILMETGGNRLPPASS